jgi:hypothetical protein
VACGAHHLGKEALGEFIAVEDGVFRAFLVIDDELHRDARAVRPCAAGGVAP